MAAEQVKISVRSLVEFILRSGDIDNMSGSEPVSVDAMLEGGRIHRKLQKEGGPDYEAEAALSHTSRIDDQIQITVSGRADGIISSRRLDTDEEGNLGIRDIITIDEIKGTYRNLGHITQPVPVHLAQAKCYACFYSLDSPLFDRENAQEEGTLPAKLIVRLTYVNMKSGDIKRFEEEQEPDQLRQWYRDLIAKYAVWVKKRAAWREKRDDSVHSLHFPFAYRPGQKRMIAAVYQTITQGKRIFAMAPTGTGKTLAVLYPAIQAQGAGICEKIFYLTSKNVTAAVASDTFDLLRGGGKGLKIKTVQLTARDKICLFDEARCSPAICPRAKGHFDRVNEALMEMLVQEDAMDRACLERYAAAHNVCPYELALDASEWADAVICDYNYVFDPDVALKRFFASGKGDYIFLIDEAHNLVERARTMYSASLSLGQLDGAARQLKGLDRTFSRKLSSCRKIMRQMRGDEEDGSKEDGLVVRDNIDSMAGALASLQSRMEEMLKTEMAPAAREDLIQFYFSVRAFMNAFERSGKRYTIYSTARGRSFDLHIACQDPSADLGERLARGRAAVFFSATLLPVAYYKEMLSDTGGEDYDLYVESPFDREKRLLFMASDVSSRYSRRGREEYEKIASYIYSVIRARHGNYMVFFPSYALMNAVYEVFSDLFLRAAGNGINIRMQDPDMSEQDRLDFLDAFKDSGTGSVTGFCVMGGVFSEGIDLKADRLIGAVIVGTGLPQVCDERELLKRYFDSRGLDGFAYAYLYPGMNKVLQAAGRVIRTDTDEGVIALLDERFSYSSCRALFPREWSDCRKFRLDQASSAVEDFWTERMRAGEQPAGEE